ncbi:hypothetical protein HNP21_005474 [Bacillus aryabhattai]|uniref:Uncharacterized protein n=1 Tax=Priestia aryabhattai TaxID=412384 RepID=A0A7W3NG27_PRIAR|nr:hypothetical protein [Priestia aryabhattai]MBA9042339.1 hypothetical protein [Priestia aryabhattai]
MLFLIEVKLPIEYNYVIFLIDLGECTVLNSWRVTKYNPLHRNNEGSYLYDDWTSFHEVGDKVSLVNYLRVEEAYIQAIVAFMNDMNITTVYIHALELSSDRLTIQNEYDFTSDLWIGKSISIEEVKKLAKLTLREEAWCKLGIKNQFFVHFGYDYYMYIGANSTCYGARKSVESLGLYVEKFESPY